MARAKATAGTPATVALTAAGIPFAAHPYAGDAVLLRRCDDLGKDGEAAPLSLEEFREDIEALDQTRPAPSR